MEKSYHNSQNCWWLNEPNWIFFSNDKTTHLIASIILKGNFFFVILAIMTNKDKANLKILREKISKNSDHVCQMLDMFAINNNIWRTRKREKKRPVYFGKNIKERQTDRQTDKDRDRVVARNEYWIDRSPMMIKKNKTTTTGILCLFQFILSFQHAHIFLWDNFFFG